MRADHFNQYFDAIHVIQSQEMIRAMSVADYPNAKHEARRRMHKETFRSAYPHYFESLPKVSADKFFGKPRVKDKDGE